MKDFVQKVYDYYNTHGRSFPWRETTDPYRIVVSEVMLQQTQTYRVHDKYLAFIEAFPTIESLAQATQREVVRLWQGLGYNRRALHLQALAQKVVLEFNGTVPDDPEILATFKGIGPATAASICAFAFNKPTVFIETNIRAVYIHCFFNKGQVTDKELLPIIEETLDKENPRIWYYALMDYGVMLKKEHKNPSRKSAHHTKQSTFEGSNRQVRGQVLKLLLQTPSLSQDFFIESIARKPEVTIQVLNDLEQEGFIVSHKGDYRLTT